MFIFPVCTLKAIVRVGPDAIYLVLTLSHTHKNTTRRRTHAQHTVRITRRRETSVVVFFGGGFCLFFFIRL